MGHRNICCDGCGRTNFTGRRYKCLRCGNYDLCGNCFDSGIVTLDHMSDHPMQLILDRALRELHFAGESFDEMHLPNCYTCPYCGAAGYTAKRFIDHVIAEHRHADAYVICPMCAVMPNIDVMQMRNLWRHLQHMHTQHANLLDPLGPTLRRPLNAARLSRRTRRRFGAAAAIASMFNSSGGVNVSNGAATVGSGETEPVLDILFQITESRCGARPEPNINLPIDGRRVSVEGFEILEERTDAVGGSQPNTNTTVFGPICNISAATERASTVSVSGAFTTEDLLALCSTNISNYCEQNFLLPPMIAELAKEQSTTIEIDMMRLKRAHFVEQLVMSALAHDKLMLPNEPNSETQKSGLTYKTETQVDKPLMVSALKSISPTNFNTMLLKDLTEAKQKIE